MADVNKSTPSNAIQEAIRAKRDRKTDTSVDLVQQEAALLADIAAFDLDAVEREAQRSAAATANNGAAPADTLAFPSIVGAGAFRSIGDRPLPVGGSQPAARPASSLLDGLRAQAESQLQANDLAQAQRSAVSERIDVALKQLFFYLHDLVQQLNVIKPTIDRLYPVIEDQGLSQLEWREGFTDYRAQAQSAGGYVELVSLSYQLARDEALRIRRNSLGIERFRTFLFDYGLLFSCKEFRDGRGQLEAAEFEIPAKLAVNARWRADFAQGTVVLELRNVERFGNTNYVLQPSAIDQALCEEFARLLLAQPNRFRELAKR